MPQHGDDIILHQDEVEHVAGMVLVTGLQDIYANNTPIDDLVAITGGQSPTEAEHNLVVTTVNEILGTLRSSFVIPEE